MLSLTTVPDTAYELCTKHVPDCLAPIPDNNTGSPTTSKDKDSNRTETMTNEQLANNTISTEANVSPHTCIICRKQQASKFYFGIEDQV